MKPLSMVLEGIKPIAKSMGLGENTSNILQLTSMGDVGQTNIQIARAATVATENENTRKQQSEACLGLKTPISKDLESKKKLTLLVKSCYESLNTYGKSPEQMEATVMLMQMILGRFDYGTVREAFEVYLQQSSDMPKPADIVKIIEPPIPEKKWCGTTFIDIKRRMRENQFISDSEKQYCNDFIAARVKAPEQDRGMIEDSIKQVEQQNKQYWIE